MKNKLNNVIVVILIAVICLNFIFPQAIYAQEYEDPLGNLALSALDGLLGIVLIPIKILLLVPAVIINIVLSTIAGIGNQWDTITLEKIFFNQINITDINIFKTEGIADSIVQIRTTIAGFYVAFRNLAIVLSLAVLIYIGIHMLINSVAEERAKYKQMLVNWVIGFGLIFILHYIIVITIKANELLVASLSRGDSFSNDYMQQLLGQVWEISFTTAFASIVMYSGLLIMTFVFLIVYMKRMLTISFLVVIAPLISVTYAIDKLDNNRSEILNAWLKEFMYNVLIQPFHCLLYLIFIGTAMNLIAQKGTLDFGAMVFAIILTFCIFLGQKIIREIFGFGESKSLIEKVATFAIATKSISTVKNIVAVRNAKNEILAQRRLNKLPQYTADGEKTTLQNMAKNIKLAKERRNNSTPQGRTTAQTQTRQTNNARTQVKKRRILKNAPYIVKKTIRGYGRLLGTATGYKLVKGVIKQREKNKIYKMVDEDFFIGASEAYRTAINETMTNEELAQKAIELYNKQDYVGLTAEEVNFKTWIAKMDEKFTRRGKDTATELENLILYGNSNNM